MSLRSWIRNLFARTASHPTRKAPNRAGLVVEALEDRRVPAAFTVTNVLDDGSVGSLRWAISQANATAGADTISFSSTVFNTPRTIALTGGQLTLTDPAATTITGPGAGLLSISGNNASRVLRVNVGATAALSGLTITGGLRTDTLGGDGVLNYGSLSMTGCNISNNSASGSGGGLVAVNATTTLTSCTISGNHAAGSLAGGLTFQGGSASLIGCTISGNAAYEAGGLLDAAATVWLTNCTVAGNSAASGGVVVRTGSPVVTLTNCTVSGNSSSNGSALRNNTGQADRLVLNNTLVAGQAAGWDILGPASGSNNLIGTGGSGGLVDGANGNLVGADPLLAPLGDYGGPTQTMPLLPGSPAIDAGSNALISRTTDQRGLARTVNGTVDIGAFESSGFTIAVVSGNNQVGITTLFYVASGDEIDVVVLPAIFAPLVVQVTANNPIE